MFRKSGIAAAVLCAVLCAVLAGIPQADATTTVGAQLDWVVTASAHPAVPDSELRAHLAPGFLTAVGGPAAFDSILAKIGRLSVRRVVSQDSKKLTAVVVDRTGAAYLLLLRVDRDGRLDALLLGPPPAQDTPRPTSWAEVDSAWAKLGGQVSFAAADIDPNGACTLVHGIDADTQRPLGSAFKLYVLGALGQAVAEHRASWNEPLAIRDDWKSLPSGVMQELPAGTELPLANYADHMISISDNTAADHLIHRLGRDAVQRQLALFGNQDPARDTPFLTTKAMFELKANGYPLGADAYNALPEPARAAVLPQLEELPLPQLTSIWPRPEAIDSVEWFGSPMDICRAFAGLRRLDQPQIDHALRINDAGLGLDPARFPAVWFKGGSEPGVLTLNFLARTATGRTLVTSLMVANPTTAFSDARIILTAIPALRGAFDLLADHG